MLRIKFIHQLISVDFQLTIPFVAKTDFQWLNVTRVTMVNPNLNLNPKKKKRKVRTSNPRHQPTVAAAKKPSSEFRPKFQSPHGLPAQPTPAPKKTAPASLDSFPTMATLQTPSPAAILTVSPETSPETATVTASSDAPEIQPHQE